MYYLEAGYSKHSRLRNAVLLALALHAALLLGISFQSSPADYRTPQIEVTLATRPNDQALNEARHIAQANQDGGGDSAEVAQLTSPDNALTSDGEAGPQALLQPQESPDDPHRDTVTTAAAALRTVAPEQREKEQLPLLGVSPEVDKLTRELAYLEAELDEQSRNYAEMPRVRRLTSVAARQSVDAAYLLDWRRRVEAVGNKYYPEASVRYGLYGKLRLLVVIRADGSLQDIRLLSSSGYAVLDEAAIKIVRMASPYAPFPAELRATTDQLEIIRTWQFQENRLSSH
ncbi:MAG: energy transducer TonB [Halioglobus sp.]|nr:energy transducer TonB [Halioglobus sp.]MCB1709542.1 energy transducer TonB [Halioglobus sp.]MCP5121317.1 energy transducer TonB [Pseudomonadales bacterium]MCP5193343.1 energy transducer TonB [Pseudomonadales bacterium]